MKKITVLFLIAGMCIFAACGPSAEEEAAKREAAIDSVKQVEEAEMARMAAEAQAELEAQAKLEAQAAEDTTAAEEGEE